MGAKRIIAGVLFVCIAGAGTFLLLRRDDPPGYREQACGLPSETLELAKRSLSPERSGDIFLVPRVPLVLLDDRGEAGADPTLMRVPLIFRGPGRIDPAEVDAEATHADIAPTVAALLHGSFQSGGGRALDEVASLSSENLGRPSPRLVVTVVLSGLGSEVLNARLGEWPNLERLMGQGASYPNATVGSLSVSRASVAATVGTGSFPATHGITGAFVRNPAGEVVEAFGDEGPVGAPLQLLVPTLGERWLDSSGDGARPPQTALVGLVSQDTPFMERGPRFVRFDENGDPVSTARGQTDAVGALVDRQLYGADSLPDLVTVIYPEVEAPSVDERTGALTESVRIQDAELGRLVGQLDRSVGARRWVLVVTADRGRSVEARSGIPEEQIAAAIDHEFGAITEAISGGQVFLDPQSSVSVDDVAEWLIGRTVSEFGDSDALVVEPSDPAFEAAVPTKTLIEIEC